MRRTLIAAVLSCLLFTAMHAQETPTTQIFAGFSTEATRAPNGGCSLYDGWNASIARKFFWRVSLVADFGGHYGRENEVVDNSVHTFLFGPRVTLHNGRIVPFVQTLFGVSHLRADAGGPVLGVNAFTLAAGGGVDLRINRRWAIRMLQIDYFHREFFGEPPHAGRISGGLVYHFGG